MQHLVISDGHVSPKDDLNRFSWLGQLIVDRRPDKIINIGDLGTYDSVSFYEHEGRKPKLDEDIQSVKLAQDITFAPLRKLQKQQRRNKQKIYEPDTIEAGGNHEDRIKRVLDKDPNGIGSVVNFDKLTDFGYWKHRVRYGEYVVIDGIQYTHCPLNKMNRPVTGMYRGLKIARESYYPTVYGHTHEFDFSSAPMLGQQNGVRWSMNAPCFMPDQHKEEYARHSQTGWFYGVLIIRPSRQLGVPPGFEYISMRDLETMYG